MFDQNKIYLQKESMLKSQGRKYSLTTNDKVIGRIEETLESRKNLGNQAFKFLGLYNAAGIDLSIVDNNENIIGMIKKEKGFYKNFKIFSRDKVFLAEINSLVKIKSPQMTVISRDGEELVRASGGFGATDFSIIDLKTNEAFSSIKRRSLVYSSIKDNLVKHDGFYIDTSNADSFRSLALLAMSIMVDIYFFNN
ncbi:hypothetical protein ACQCVP_13990 [Rossellomorea vietnamensis]|uniref:hypothetical protein n=1 Tax=Rossellomorea vietnamensis TaxID=218284 RepID=UPI003CE6A199